MYKGEYEKLEEDCKKRKQEDSLQKFDFNTWKKHNKSTINYMYELFLESCNKNGIKMIDCKELYDELSIYFYHHVEGSSIINCPMDLQ